MVDRAPGAAPSPVSVVAAWRWLVLWMVASVAIDAWLPDRVAVDRPVSLTEAPGGWAVSPGMDVSASQGGLRFAGPGPGPHTATRLVQVSGETEFIALEACVIEPLAPGKAGIMLASVAAGGLDFNRNYLLGTVFGAGATQCFREALPRREGDAAALLQVQLMGVEPAALSLSRLSLTPLKESPAWRWTRRAMLAAGLVLIALRFRGYLRARPLLPALGGLGVVAVIVFGCAVSVPLKADIYALFTGGRSLPVPADIAALLLEPFPVGGFGIFTGMHAVLFAAAALLLGLVRGWTAWIDLLLLAAATETLQRFVPGRGPGVSDMLVDWSGLLLGALLVVLLRRSQRVRLFLKQQGVDENAAGL